MKLNRLLALTCVLLLPPVVLGQSTDEEDAEATEMAEETIVVTGSRIRRDEFTSAAPIQIIDGAASREIGLIDTAFLLQSATQATGQQIDNTFTAFVLDNGPGSAQVNLRGLGADRVLLMLNNRRLAPGGVGGAPTTPDLSTIPSIMVDRIEFLLDGASSIYGSDAVSGVANVIMRSDFDGFEFEANVVDTDAGGGDEKTFGAAWGKTGDNWTVGIAAEYYDRKSLALKDRSFTEQCDRWIYEDENGNILNDDVSLVPGTTISPCKLNTINRVFIPIGYGNVWFTPGETNIGIPNFSETEVPVGFAPFNPTINPVDTDGDGIPDTGIVDPDGNGLTEVDLQTEAYNYNGSTRERSGDFLTGSERTNIYAYGEYDLQDEGNTTLYFETLHSKRETDLYDSFSFGIFPEVPADNPYNPCNQDAPGGVNCIGFFGGLNFGNVETTPIVVIRGDRDFTEVELEQARWVAGVRGDLPSLQTDWGLANWSYDAYVSYSTSDGRDVQAGILEAELTRGIETAAFDGAGNVVCGDDANGDGIPDGNDCVPINMFAPSIYQAGGGTFATQAETDYVFGRRVFDTEVDQTIVSGTLQGDVWRLPWNDTVVPLVLGVEYRKDEINSVPNDVAREGQIIAFFRDGGAKGDRDIKELFFETELMLLENVEGADELSLNLSARYTDESTYGDDVTYSTKLLYSPVEGLTLRGTRGTSFRAPNAREQFLIGQSGFATVVDPCVVPVSARIPSLNPGEDDTYDPTMDPRAQTTLDNCNANGVDPTALGLDGILSQYSVERIRKGGEQVQLEIDPETSESYTAGIVIDQTLWDSFTLRFGATLYDIEVEDSIALLSTQFVVNDCYVESENNSSSFCRFITRDAAGLLDEVDASFINVNTLSSRGVDYNVFFQKDFVVFDRNLGLDVDLRVTRILKNLFEFGDAQEDDASTTVAPEWEGTLLLTANYGDFRFNWRTNYISGEEETQTAFGSAPPCETLGVLCRPVSETDYYWNHSTSVTWTPRNWELTLGVVNVFDDDPPLLDGDAPELQWNNVPLGAGYDLLGRRVFFSVRASL
jgi:iron complex outermembrane receptor protein